MTPEMTRPALPSLALLIAVQTVVSAASLVVEIVAGRMLAPYVGMSLYTWTAVIAVVLAGFSAGHWLGGRLAERAAPRALVATAWCVAAAALTTGLATFLLRWLAGPVIEAVEAPVTAIVVLTGLVFFLPSFFAGVPAPVLAKIAVEADPAHSGRALGGMFAAGALGAIFGTLAAGFLFISWIGSVGTLAAVTAVYAGLALMTFRAAAVAGARTPVAVLLLAALVTLLPAGLSLARPDPCTRETDYFCIRVIDISARAEEPVREMVLDHLSHGRAAEHYPGILLYDHAAMIDRLARARLGERAFSAFFIGGGTFSVPRAWAARDPAPKVTVAEIDPGVTEVAARDFWFDTTTSRVLTEDARRALTSRPDRYDVIVGDAFTDIAVPPHLVTREFFRLVASRLEPEGIYLMNVIDHADRLEALAAIVRTLGAEFPVVEVWTEWRDPEPGERMVFIVLAGSTPSPMGRLLTRTTGPLEFGRFPQVVEDEMLATRPGPVLTDDHAPIHRLMRWQD